MKADDRILLLDLENLGTARLRPRPLRARLEALLGAAGEIHHAAAAYALPDAANGDQLASLLAELRIAPLRVAPGADAAELALLDHARRVHLRGARIFLVGSADGRFAELADLGRVELLVWESQPVAARLTQVVHHIHRLPRPASSADGTETQPRLNGEPTDAPTAPSIPSAHGYLRSEQLITALVTGMGIAIGHRLLDAMLPRRKR